MRLHLLRDPRHPTMSQLFEINGLRSQVTMDSFENLVPPLPTTEATVLDAGAPRPIKIVRDGILAFVGAISLSVGIVIGIVIAEIISGAIKPSSFERFMPTPGFVVGGLIASALPF